jgi:ABC-type Fe3+ transport system substrate-binding protein
MSEAMQKLIEAAKVEKTLEVTIAFDDRAWNELEALINSKYGIKINLRGMAGAPPMSKVTSKLIEEHKAGRKPASTGLMISNGANHAALAEAGVLMAIDWKKYLPDLKAGEMTKDSTGLLGGVGPIVLVYNTKVIKDVPKSLDDLANPKYKGLIAATFWGGGFVQMAVPLGAERMMKLVEQMVDNGNLVGSIGSEPDRIASGEFGMLAFLGDNVEPERLKARGAPVEWSTLGGEMNAAFGSWLGVPKASASPNIATLVALFMLTPDGQKFYYKYNQKDSHLREGTVMSKTVPKGVYLETPDSVVANPQVYKGAYEKIQKLIQRGAGK